MTTASNGMVPDGFYRKFKELVAPLIKDEDFDRLLGDPTHTYAYDANGNQTGKTERTGGGSTDYIYDSENQMIRVDLPNSTAVSFKYDDLGRRIEKIGPQTLRYVYDDEDIIAILDGSNQPLMIFTHGPGIDEPLQMRKPDGSEITLHADGLGSIVSHADANGTVIERIEHEAYGAPTFVDVRNITPSTAAVSFTGSPYAYTGREWDVECNLHYYRKRYYDSSGGRFTTEDPIGFAGDSLQRPQVNFYAYTDNNPIIRTDPFGLYWEYSQSSRRLVYVDDQTGARTFIGLGYSGFGPGLNNPAMQHIRNVGPIPQGNWTIGNLRNSRRIGAAAMDLTPEDQDVLRGRDNDFRIHGDTRARNNTASRGCIILHRNYRERIGRSRDRRLIVIP